MATTSKRKMIREATSSVQGRQAERTRQPATRQPAAPSATPPSRVGARSQVQGGPKLNELRGKIARIEKERTATRDQALGELAQIEELLGQLTMTSFSMVATATRVAEIRTHIDTLRKVLA